MFIYNRGTISGRPTTQAPQEPSKREPEFIRTEEPFLGGLWKIQFSVELGYGTNVIRNRGTVTGRPNRPEEPMFIKNRGTISGRS